MESEGGRKGEAGMETAGRKERNQHIACQGRRTEKSSLKRQIPQTGLGLSFFFFFGNIIQVAQWDAETVC